MGASASSSEAPQRSWELSCASRDVLAAARHKAEPPARRGAAAAAPKEGPAPFWAAVTGGLWGGSWPGVRTRPCWCRVQEAVVAGPCCGGTPGGSSGDVRLQGGGPGAAKLNIPITRHCTADVGIHVLAALYVSSSAHAGAPPCACALSPTVGGEAGREGRRDLSSHLNTIARCALKAPRVCARSHP